MCNKIVECMREWNVLTHCEKVKKGSGMKSLSLWFVMLYLYSIKISFICLYTWTWNILYTQIWNIVFCMSGRWNRCRVCKCDWCVALELCSYASSPSGLLLCTYFLHSLHFCVAMLLSFFRGWFLLFHQYTMETKSLSIINISVHAC
jgi:hypothetical protein